MERIERNFLNILRAALKGETLREPLDMSREEWLHLMELAQSHHVLPMVFQAVHKLPEVKDAPFFLSLKQQIRRQVFVQTQKTCDFLAVNARLQAAGVTPLVVKGIICRSLYPCPDHRVSGDEDLLIPPEQTGLAHQVLTDLGMTAGLEPDAFATAYEIPYRKADSPLYIELHRQLFPPESEAYGDLNRFFEDVFRRSVTVTIQGEAVGTMCATDHLFYLICHAFKHFLHSGFGIRQLCDIILFANVHGCGIHWDQVQENCRTIRAHRFAAALFRIGEKHLGFDPARACYPESWQQTEIDEQKLLEDLLGSGLYGDASMSRKHSSSITLDAVAARNQGKRSRNPVLLSLFPPVKKLESRFPYLKAHPWLLPVAWGQRIIVYRKESRTTSHNAPSESLKIGSQRIELLREYGIIE